MWASVARTQLRRAVLIGERILGSLVGRWAKRAVLLSGLLIAYFVILLPVAIWRWWLPGRKLSTWDDRSGGGWRPTSQSTSSVENCESAAVGLRSKKASRFASSRDGITKLARTPGAWWIRLLYELVILLTIFSDPPKERELRSDLYVLF